MISLNTFALLKSIGAAPETFSAVEAEFEKASIAIVKKLLKAKGLTVAKARDICSAIGADSVGFVLGHVSMTNNDISGIVKKLDKHWSAIKTARIDEQREHILELATRRAEPTEKPIVTATTPRKQKPKAKKAEWSKSMSARGQKG